MKVAIITDQHFGLKKGSKIYHEYFQKFYDQIFFPTLEKENISMVFDLGDTFDNRKVIDLWSLDWAKRNYYDKLEKMKVHVWTVVGNHTAYYKNTNEFNTINAILNKYDNVTKIHNPQELVIGDLQILFIPWINEENEDITMRLIESTKATVAMGHLELTGFSMYRGMVQETGLDPQIFSKFKRVFSGHYHTRSNNGKIFYLGNPYQIYWNDCDDTRGFHIFDTETLELTPINNTFELFKKINYSDTKHQLFDFRSCAEKYVKLIVDKKTNQARYDAFLDKLLTSDCHEVKVIENFTINDIEDVDLGQIEDTVSILNKYVEDSEISLNKKTIMSYIKEIYKEASEVG
jgi:DNA repair exonuclease SbcCD nuclease subunit